VVEEIRFRALIGFSKRVAGMRKLEKVSHVLKFSKENERVC
jgi:hypothetical protein